MVAKLAHVHDKVLVGQRNTRIQDRLDSVRMSVRRLNDRRAIVSGADVRHSLRQESAGKDRQPAEEGLLLMIEQVDAPGDGVANTPLVSRAIERSPSQDIVRTGEALDDCVR